MKKILLLLAVMLAIIPARSQVITGCEYFFDTDPGVGNGAALPVTSGDSVILSTTVPTAGLTSGFHRLYVRTQNVDGAWSLYEGRTFFIQAALTPNTALLVEAEYFFDTDPGVGSGTAFTVTVGDSLSFNTTVATAGLTNGFHRLYVRARNADGKWSLYEGRTLYIQNPSNPNTGQLVAAEYFFDTDPGVENGTAFTITPGDSLLISATVPTTGLSDGFHRLFVRAQNSDGRWSLYEGRTFYTQEPNPDTGQVQITYAEYFFDTDLGQGNSISMNITPGDSIDGTFSLPENLTLGVHTVVLRCKNSLDKWSLNEPRQFMVGWPSVEEIDPNKPTLFQNYPNPFSSSTEIGFNLVKADEVTISITDLLGKKIREISLENVSPGKHYVIIDRNDLEAGYYFYKLSTKDFESTKQMILSK